MGRECIAEAARLTLKGIRVWDSDVVSAVTIKLQLRFPANHNILHFKLKNGANDNFVESPTPSIHQCELQVLTRLRLLGVPPRREPKAVWAPLTMTMSRAILVNAGYMPHVLTRIFDDMQIFVYTKLRPYQFTFSYDQNFGWALWVLRQFVDTTAPIMGSFVMDPATGLLVQGRILGRNELLEHRRLARIKQSYGVFTVNDDASIQAGSRSQGHSPIPKSEQKSDSRLSPEGVWSSLLRQLAVCQQGGYWQKTWCFARTQ
ncbi:hypothetical protein BJY52DRAFT_1232099 [Lactarius psammicola]|nr:hypothetical protein BJY52DRAFT_1232099 [Lactarius psammicola]